MDNLIELIRFILLGAVQGITETLPISSSGHLVIVQELAGFEDNNDLILEVLLHLGSLIAIVYFYRKVIIDLVKNFFLYLFKKEEAAFDDFKFAWLIVFASVPTAIIGLFFEEELETYLTSTLTVAFALLFTALVLFIISKLPRGEKTIGNMTLFDALWIGLMQAFAIIPGISRSGSTVSMGLYRKLTIDHALRFSFLLFVPATLGASLLKFIDFLQAPESLTEPVLSIIAFFTSILFTFFSLQVFIGILKRGKLIYFSYYCIFASIVSFYLAFR